MKTNRATAKRMRITGSGKVVHRKSNASHYFKSKSRSRQMRLKGNSVAQGGDAARARALLAQ